MVLDGGLSPCSLLLAFGESVRATSFLGQVVEVKFWAYAWMVHLANSVVSRAPGIRV
ncbi:hypothetical protein SACC_13630 [Saccharolobus caldissimus]|uniref:Uncharacterized protein n=1 Tax=Saccharolobus caldissimus TaxID=1702097 RepID=A0AAQ4CRB5_9CREN|nr:hypothetical protein SACC_13630 [Saccharolobus caldissimus]